jgi:DNA-directed RNA polymerase specialized sigma24 family protein
MSASDERKPMQVVPFGNRLPAMIDCIPNSMAGAPGSKFHTTSWTLIRAAAVHPTTDSREALARLCQAYWHPVYAFIRRSGYDQDQSQDLCQGFFAVLIEKNYLLDADRERGRFRSFLLTAVKHFLANERDRANALKRGGGQVSVSIDVVEAERHYAPTAVEEATPESLFERRWALSVMERVMVKLRAAFTAKGKADQVDNLSKFLSRESEDPRYAEMAEQMGLSVGALRTAVYRMRREHRKLLYAEIAETVSGPDEIEEEIRFLLSALRRPR